MNELDVKDLAPVVEAAPPTMSDAGMNNNAVKSAIKRHPLSLPKPCSNAVIPKRGSKDLDRVVANMTEATMRGLNWLKSAQDEDGGWGIKTRMTLLT